VQEWLCNQKTQSVFLNLTTLFLSKNKTKGIIMPNGYVQVRTNSKKHRDTVLPSSRVEVKYDVDVRTAYLLDKAIANALSRGITFDRKTVNALRRKIKANVKEQNDV